MKIIYNNLIPFNGFSAINLFGIIFIRKDARINDLFEVINHERIHTAQMKETFYIGFYLLYLLEWTVGLFVYKSSIKSYKNISFEKEANANEKDYGYLMKRKMFNFLDYM